MTADRSIRSRGGQLITPVLRRFAVPRRKGSRLRRVDTWALWSSPPRVIATLLAVVAAAIAWAVVGLLTTTYDSATLSRDLLILTLGIGFEEVSRGIARLRTRLVDTGLANMLSVWLFAAAVALPVPHAIVVCFILSTHRWLRQQPGPGGRLYRRVYSTAVGMLGTGAASAVAHSVPTWTGNMGVATGLIAGSAAALAMTSRLLVFGMISLVESRVDLRALVGRWTDYSLEFATLCLGALTGLAVVVEPPLAILVLVPAYALQRGALVRELEVAASHDPKTGLLNPIAWQTLAKRELSRAQREDQPATVLIIDLDHFKRVNDRWGHVAGDAVLKAVGHCLREELRKYDSIGRFGGEEFVAILPDVDEPQAAVIAERLRGRVAELRIASIAETTNNPTAAAQSGDTLSTSVGVACFPEHGDELDRLLLGADAALYRAKELGRNRVVFADTPGPETRELVSD